MWAILGISAATNALNVGAASLPVVGPDKTALALLTVSLSKNPPIPPIFITLVADPPAPPVPFPINRVSLPSLNASSALASEVGADDPVDLLIHKVFAMLEVSSFYKIFNGASLICFKCTTR